MLGKLPSLEKLIRQLQHVPYLASKNVYRVAMHFLQSGETQIEQFCQAIREAQKNISPCIDCYNWTEGSERCGICTRHNREKGIICVVETWHELVAIEKAGGYTGLYHVLGGVLCPLEGVGPDALTIEPLLKRVEREPVQEIIFATNPTPEGEATASYISSKIKDSGINITKLASGVPIGSSLAYMDRVTIYKAMAGRSTF